MGFLQPLALLGLAAVGLPALLHLLQRREPPTVPFPAVRYLAEAERRHSRRLRFRHLLLLLLRTALVGVVVLAAARPVLPLPTGGTHAPSALVLVVDNSLSSGAVVGGRRALDRLVAEARAVLAEATGADRVWLLLADGVPRAADLATARRVLDGLDPLATRLDLTEAARTASALLADISLPGEIVVLSDLQASALPAGPATDRRIVVLSPRSGPANRGVAVAGVEPPTWAPGGRVLASVAGTGGAGEVALIAGGRALARDLAGPGDVVALAVAALPSGWHAARVALQPDELRLDDTAYLALRAAPPAAVTVLPGVGTFVESAIAVLEQGGRLRRGRELTVGERPGVGRTVLLPPADAAQIGGVNRALATRGSPVRFGEPVTGEWEVSGDLPEAAGARVTRRYRLTGGDAVLARAGGEPWIVQAGDQIVLGSRLDEDWTSLPVSAAFVPLLDALLNRVAAAPVWRVAAVPDAVVPVPAAVSAVLFPGGRVRVGGDRRVAAPPAPGVYFLLGGAGDTVGALEVTPDPRESDLTPATTAAVRAALGPGAEVVARAPGRAFAAGRRAEVSTALLLLALGLAAVEFALASAGGARREALA